MKVSPSVNQSQQCDYFVSLVGHQYLSHYITTKHVTAL